ncbi:MoaD/ThiS family protein [Marinococcus halophilus]|uniref:Molybdopterin synthase sulfur carrier subunit n=1 Tax=Marinococcus halophilus TaxID=1371 RepID=A0A510Y2P2_MARHA|nr:MoaD/ThiS family protein [Marinococcus halophilus]OZT81635.1 MoaD/ThiS family protein [Marinococcus halophilus]GEK57585.1 molybdopterin synthase sulfur carrier subunit [Marinococcus halophilus]
MINVLCFAHMKDIFGGERLAINSGGIATVKDVLEHLKSAYDADVSGIMTAVNEEFAEESTPVSQGDTVALIPPVSGG